MCDPHWILRMTVRQVLGWKYWGSEKFTCSELHMCWVVMHEFDFGSMWVQIHACSIEWCSFSSNDRLPWSALLIRLATSKLGRVGHKKNRRKGNGWFRIDPTVPLEQVFRVFLLPWLFSFQRLGFWRRNKSYWGAYSTNTYWAPTIFPALVRQMDSPITSTNRLYPRGVNRHPDISKVLWKAYYGDLRFLENQVRGLGWGVSVQSLPVVC